MSYSITTLPKADADLNKIDAADRKRIVRKIVWLSVNFESVKPQALSNKLSGLFKLRVGDYRAIYSYSRENKVITIHEVGHRRDIYKQQ